MDSNNSSNAQNSLSHEEKQKLYRLLLERDFGGFIRAAWPILEPATPFSENWHLDLLAEYLTLVRRREIRRLIINVPPRSMKSLTTTVLFPAWCWTTEPHLRFIASSYSDSLSTKHSLDRRTVIASPWFQAMWGDRVKLSGDQNLKTEFSNEARGTMIATSTGAGITGKGADIIIVDDPHNPQQVLSDVERASQIRHFDHTLSTRLDDPKRGAIILVMQRLHEQDLTGHLLEQQGWEHVSLPAESERHEVWKFPITRRVVERQPGELLWPDRFPQPVLEQFKRQMGSYQFAGQYQQRPSPAEGGILKRSWWRRYDALPETFDEVIESWDFTFKDTKASDYVVGQVWGRVGSNKYLLDQVRARLSFSESIKAMRVLVQRWPSARLKLVEDKANGAAVIDTLRNELSGIVAVNPQGSKEARAHAASPDLEAGNYWLPRAEFAEQFIEEAAAFPNGAHDDMVDAWSQAADRFRVAHSGIVDYYENEAKLSQQAVTA